MMHYSILSVENPPSEVALGRGARTHPSFQKLKVGLQQTVSRPLTTADFGRYLLRSISPKTNPGPRFRHRYSLKAGTSPLAEYVSLEIISPLKCRHMSVSPLQKYAEKCDSVLSGRTAVIGRVPKCGLGLEKSGSLEFSKNRELHFFTIWNISAELNFLIVLSWNRQSKSKLMKLIVGLQDPCTPHYPLADFLNRIPVTYLRKVETGVREVRDTVQSGFGIFYS